MVLGNIFLNYLHFLTVTNVIDGDSITVKALDNKEFEVRLYGIDCPEDKVCHKLKRDEKETQLAGGFLIFLGKQSTAFVRKLLPIGTIISIAQELKNTTDIYNRELAYVILPDAKILNEELIKAGFAKPMSEYYCEELNHYQTLNFIAKKEKKGLYKFGRTF